MALKKEIELDNGMKLNYHRIASINKITNRSIIVEIASYINEEKREQELEYLSSTREDKTMNVYIHTTYLNIDYDENITIQDLYEYLKTTERFEDAKNA